MELHERLCEGDEAFQFGSEWHDKWVPVNGSLVGEPCLLPRTFRRRITDDWVKTSERLPRPEDGNSRGQVIAFWRDNPTHVMTHHTYVDALHHTHWRKLPPDPIPEQSEGDKAFLAEFESVRGHSPITAMQAKLFWDARGEWEKTRGKK